jgi:hypothetical protein
MLKIIQDIDLTINSLKLSQIEKKRLNNDLNVIFDRIKKREYIMTDFSSDNRFNIPDRTKEFFNYLDSYCDTWKTISKILNKLKVKNYDNVVDLCSGWAPKVTLWFFYSNYSKNLILVDKDKKSASKLINFMKLFNPEYKLKKVCFDLFWEFDFRSNFIVWNHIIDDLIVSYYSKKCNYNISNLYVSEKNLLKCWKNILNLWYDFKNDISNELFRILNKMSTKDWIIILSQYQSMIEYLLDMNDVTNYNKDVLLNVKEIFLKSGYEDIWGFLPEVLKWKKEAFKSSECIILRKK